MEMMASRLATWRSMLFTSGTSGVPMRKSTKLVVPKYIGVSLVGGNLPPGQQENVVKVGLQFTFSVIVRLGVVVGDGDKVETARRRCFDGQKKWARNLLSHAALAGPIAVCRMHVQVAAIPGGSGPQVQGEQWVLCLVPGGAVEVDLRSKLRGHIWPDVGHPQQQSPGARLNRARQVGGRCVSSKRA